MCKRFSLTLPLSPTSCHPPHIIKSIPHSQALRIKRICTDHQTLLNELNNLKGFFMNRNYPPVLVNTAIQKVLMHDHNKKSTNTKNGDLPIPTALVVPYHPTNPPFQHTINLIWKKHQTKLNNMIGKPIVAFKRPKNLKDLLTKARYGPRAIPIDDDPMHTATKRPITTFDRSQMEAPVKHIMFYCNQHSELQEDFDTLALALSSKKFQTFTLMHDQCNNVSLIPVDVIHNVRVKCNECHFSATATTTKRTERVKKELLNICHTAQQARLRAIPTHKPCLKFCKTCKLIWHKENVVNSSGTSYRLTPFNCKARQVVYIIHCALCDMNYVGMTNTTLKQRMANHLSCIKNWRDTSVSKHFTTSPHDVKIHFKVAILDINMGNADNTSIREGFWINELRTVSNGLNEREEMNLNMDYQLVTLARHFYHSRTCAPCLSFYLQEVRTRHLNSFRRNIINTRAPIRRSALADPGHDQSRDAARILRHQRGT